VGAGLATVLGNLQVVVVPFVAWAVLGEDPTALQLAGVACILAGLVSVALRRDRSRRPIPEPA
jgi:drug/metabolite transporter (DMT)-like permease